MVDDRLVSRSLAIPYDGPILTTCGDYVTRAAMRGFALAWLDAGTPHPARALSLSTADAQCAGCPLQLITEPDLIIAATILYFAFIESTKLK